MKREQIGAVSGEKSGRNRPSMRRLVKAVKAKRPRLVARHTECWLMLAGAVIVFAGADAHFALRRGEASGLAPVPKLVAPPNAPLALAGFFQRGFELVSVLKFNVLFGLAPADDLGFYDHLIILRRLAPKIALAVDRVESVFEPGADDVSTVAPGQSHRDCVIAEINGHGDPILLIDVDCVITAYELERMEHFLEIERRRRSVLEEIE